MRCFPTVLVLALGLSVAAPAAASEPLTHDGFLLRLSLGVGYESLSIDDGAGTDIGIGGMGGGWSIALGGMVADNLSINADLFGSIVFDPSVEQNGVDLGEAQDTSVSLAAIGVGITYYLMPVNIYLAGSIGIGTTTITVEGTDFESDAGLAINAMIGKEFWVGREWGVGVAAQVLWSNVPTELEEASASYFAFNVLFTATYN